MPTFIKTGYWEKIAKGYNSWLNLEQLVVNTAYPSQAGNNGKFLQTNGTTVSWQSVPNEIPTQTGADAGKFLQASGTGTLSFQTIYAISSGSLPVYFSNTQIYGTATSPLTGNITGNLLGAQLGVVQKIYHNDGVAPTFPVGWVQLGTTTYTTSTLNIIYAEWAGGTRVEYWIVQ